MLRYATLCYATLRLCHAMLHAMPYDMHYAMPYAMLILMLMLMLCYAMLCYAWPPELAEGANVDFQRSLAWDCYEPHVIPSVKAHCDQVFGGL